MFPRSCNLSQPVHRLPILRWVSNRYQALDGGLFEAGGDVGIPQCHLETLMPQEFSYCIQIDPVHDQIRGKGTSQVVQGCSWDVRRLAVLLIADHEHIVGEVDISAQCLRLQAAVERLVSQSA